MKRTTNLWTVLMIMFAVTACQKSEIRKNETSADLQSKKPGAGKTSSPVFGGQATGANAIVVNTGNYVVVSNQSIFAQTPFLPATGGMQTAGQFNASIPGVLSIDTLTAQISGQGNQTTAQASATNVQLNIGGHVLSARSLQSTATTNCGGTVTGSSQIDQLVLNGTTINVTGLPNQTVFLPSGGLLIINEQSTSKRGSSATLTVTAIHLILPYGSDVRIASARSEIKC